MSTADEDKVAKARASCGMPEQEMRDCLTVKEDYDQVLNACANNVKMGPWKATSGLILKYYLNAATNLMDRSVATQCTRMVLDLIKHKFKPSDPNEPLLVVGLEMAGGVMVGQCTALCQLTHPGMLEWCDFVYCRKDRKTTGTKQQLEGPNRIILRDKEENRVKPMKAVLLDDAQSTGGSLRDAAILLKDDYNIDLVGAIYLVDRSRDRAEVPVEKLGRTHSSLDNCEILALFDLEQIDVLVPPPIEAKNSTEVGRDDL